MSEALVLGGIGSWVRWGSALVPHNVNQDAQRKPSQASRNNAWLSSEDVAQMLLCGECLEARVSVPLRFSPQALASAVRSVQRWQQEGRIFAVHDLYPSYQFDSLGRPHPPVERALAVLGSAGVLRVGNWFALPNTHLQGRRPQDLLATEADAVVLALAHA